MWADLGWMKAAPCSDANPVESRLFDSTRGFPGEGPAGRRRSTTGEVPRQDLRVRVENKTAMRYTHKLQLLDRWLGENGLPPFKDLQKEESRVINKVLGTYVQYLHAVGRPTQWGTDTLAGAQFAAPSLQGHLKEAWSIQRQWCRITPMTTRTPLPLDVLLAMCVVCVTWSWNQTAALLLLGFHLLLRPGEVSSSHLLLPDDVGGSLDSGSLALTKTKTSNRGSKLQSVIIEDGVVLHFVNRVFGDFPPKALLCAGGQVSLSLRFAALKRALGLEKSPFSLASLRGGGSVHYMRTIGNVSWLQYRGRWESAKTMGHYLQAGTAMMAMAAIPRDVTHRIKALAQLAPTLLWS
eukprot:6464124-Amphidinium_carterae.1